MNIRTDAREETPPLAPLEPRAGYCRDHPTQRLVTHKVAGVRGYWGEDPAVVCVACPANAQDRCRWDGRPLHDPAQPYWQRNPRKTYCTPGCRLRAHRASRRAA